MNLFFIFTEYAKINLQAKLLNPLTISIGKIDNDYQF